MHLELTDEQIEALIRELSLIIDGDRYPISPRIVVLREILGQLRPEPARQPLPPRRHYEPPSKGRYRRRGQMNSQDAIKTHTTPAPPPD
jgi:hypothetical protein